MKKYYKFYINIERRFIVTNVSLKDREILRELAARKAALAHSARNDEILKMWNKQAKGVRDTPTVRLLFSNFPR